MSGDRSKFKEENNLLYGIHPEGILEIKFHNPKKRNAWSKDTQAKIAELMKMANKDENIKVVLMHGGSYYSSGNDLGAFATAGKTGDFEKAINDARDGATVVMVDSLTSVLDLEKPLVCMVSGAAFGIACTMTALADFIYCTPDATFNAPFMSSFQSPEGGSTVTFPIQMGRRVASEVILAEKPLGAMEAKQIGFINGILDPKVVLLEGGDFFDVIKIPCIPKLLSNDVKTMVNAKKLITQGMNREFMVECFKREGQALFDSWMDPEFFPKIMSYLKKNSNKKGSTQAGNGKPKL